MQSSSTDRTTKFFLLQRRRQTFEQFSSLNESKKADNPALEHILGYFHSSDENRDARPILSCFSQPDKSKRAKKMLELAIPSLFKLG
jgi:hypothetical protein